ncbi:VanZ family protein [Gracilibacillus oryzae]|uniref:VanZ family protein n=1 Tax=Gracilibacillus oryzae TaxID=1672701 RepID=UPI001D17FD71|nr:VanZ family protein [Gracilibacillus oryzae]
MFILYLCFSSYLLLFQRIATRVMNYFNGIYTNPYVYTSSESSRYIDNFLANSNLVPFRNTIRYITESDHFSILFIFNNIVGNILVFLPLGLLLPLLFPRHRKFILLLLTVTCFTILVEITQITLQIGQFDVDDLILNVIGGMAGYWFAKLLMDNVKIKSQLFM